MLCQHLKLKAQRSAKDLNAEKAQSASILNGLKNDSSYELTGEKSLHIDEDYAEMSKLKFL